MATANNQPFYLQEIEGSMSCNYSIEKYLIEKHIPKQLTIFLHESLRAMAVPSIFSDYKDLSEQRCCQKWRSTTGMVKLHELLRGAHLEDKRVSLLWDGLLIGILSRTWSASVCVQGHEAFLETAKLDEKGPCGDTKGWERDDTITVWKHWNMMYMYYY